MQARTCSECGTPLGGRRRHGFVKGRGIGRVVCGRSYIERVITTTRGSQRSVNVPSPRCRA